MLRQLTIATLLIIPISAMAQTAGSQSNSGASANTNSHQANAQSITFNGAPTPANTYEHVSGVDRTAPTVVMGGFAAGFSSDNCMNTAQAGISGPGFGASVGKGVADKNCQILRRADAHGRLGNAYVAMGNSTAAQYQYQQSAIDLCVADGYALDDCRKAIK